jgi:predicted RNA-binding protein YlqC (UPF0109 family)
MADTHSDKEFLEFLIKALVDKPEAVVVDRRTDDMGVLLTLDIDPDDMGKVIGRMGNTAKAIRTLLRVVGMKNNARVNLKINEPEGGKRAPMGAGEGLGVSMADGVLHQDVDDVIADLKAE